MNPLNRGRCARCAAGFPTQVATENGLRTYLHCAKNGVLCRKCASRCECPPMGIKIADVPGGAKISL